MDGKIMTELEKLEAGLEYCYDDPEVEAYKENAVIQCKKYNAIDDTNPKNWTAGNRPKH